MGRPEDSDDTKRLSPGERDHARQRLGGALEAEQRDSSPTELGIAPTSTPGFGAFTSEQDLAEGTRVGEYVVEQVIGRGGFGVVYRAMQPVIGKSVAIKVLAQRYSSDGEIVSRFIAEARAVNQIRHRHIIDIFSFGQLPDGHQYYVMEHLDGEPLDRYLAARGKLSLDEALPILRAVARALDAAHAKGIAHRDLKPENIFIARDADGEVFPKLLDFGVAKLLGPEPAVAHRTNTGVPIGTPYYMSPEQCRGRAVDHRTDIYAFGILTYRLLTGEYPFKGEMLEILHKQVHEQPEWPSALVPTLPSAVDEAIAWMMSKDPIDRPSTVLMAVNALVGEVPTTANFRTSAERLSARRLERPAASHGGSPRRRWWLFALPVVLMTIGVGVYLGLAKRGHAGTEPTMAPAVQPVPADAATPVELDRTAPAADAAVARPTHVIVTIDGVPEGTEVTGPDVSGVAPGPVQLPYGSERLVLTFKADGYIAASATVTPDKDQGLTVKLKKKTRPHADAPLDPERIDDPFKKKTP